MLIRDMLTYLHELPDVVVWGIFFVENIVITLSVLVTGRIVRRIFKMNHHWETYTAQEWLWCGLTNIINTIVTYTGFFLWEKRWIDITFSSSFLMVLADFMILFFTMDMLMYVFHFIIHKTVLYKLIHGLHHESVDPKPIDLFILHPVETFCFGALWLLVLVAHAFNVYAIVLYLVLNVAFGLAGHLGFEIIPNAKRKSSIWKYIGTSTFHHDHHRDVEHNFGFYTNVWDRMMRTYKA